MNGHQNYSAIFLISLALAVLLGAFGAHVLEAQISSKYADIYDTASFYHFVHSLGGLIIIILLKEKAPQYISLVAKLLIAGIILFSGSLYILSIHEILGQAGLKKLGAITPIGGLLFIIAWLYATWIMIKK